MRFVILVSALTGAGMAQAHSGHLIEAAGHDHWLGAAAIGAAILVAGLAALKGRKSEETSEEVDEGEVAEEDMQEA